MVALFLNLPVQTDSVLSIPIGIAPGGSPEIRFYLTPAYGYVQFTIKNLEYAYLVDNGLERNLNGKMKAGYGSLASGVRF